jgi:hypothetical protein
MAQSKQICTKSDCQFSHPGKSGQMSLKFWHSPQLLQT